MRKIFILSAFIFSFLFTFDSLYAKKDVSDLEQKYILDNLKELFEKAEVYEKYQNIHAREAKEGESITTITSDGLETVNTAKKGDMIVKNLTKAKEEYIVAKTKFSTRYIKIKDIDKEWSEYKPLGEIRAIKVDSSVIKKLSTGSTFYIIAAWQERMIVKKGDYLVSPLNYSEIYRIADKEFKATYRKK